MPNLTNPNIDKFAHIIGIGNITRKDDGIAIRIIEELKEINLPNNIKVSDLGTDAIDLIQALENWTLGIIIDAVDIPNLHHGEIIQYEITRENIPKISGFSSTHGFDIFTSLNIAFQLQDFHLPNKIIVIGIQVADINGLGTTLSPSVEKSKSIVIQKIMNLLNIH